MGFALELKYNTDTEAMLHLVALPRDGQERKKFKARAKFTVFADGKEKVHEMTSMLLTISTEMERVVWFSPIITKRVATMLIAGKTYDYNVDTIPNDITISFKLIIFKTPISTISSRYDHQGQVMHDLQSMYENAEFGDFVLSVDGHEFLTSKAVLAVRSPVFQRMFRIGFKEAEDNRMEVKDFSANVMHKLLEYIYKGSVDEMEECADGLLAAGHRYQVEGIQLLAAEALAKEIAVENVCQLLVTADLYGSALLKEKCLSYMTQHRSSVIQTDAWKTLISGSHVHLLVELIEGAPI